MLEFWGVDGIGAGSSCQGWAANVYILLLYVVTAPKIVNASYTVDNGDVKISILATTQILVRK